MDRNHQEFLARQGLMYGPNDKVSVFQSILLGIQHVLAMDVYVPPILIATAITVGLSAATQGAVKTSLVQATFLAAGIGTILQTKFFMKMPISAGPSFVPIGAIVGVAMSKNGGMSTVIGSMIIGSVLLMLLGLSGIFEKIIEKFIPAVCGGTIITCVGLSLMPSALDDNIFGAKDASINQNVILASVTFITLLVMIVLGLYLPKLKRVLKVSSIIIALLVGSVVASWMGLFHWSIVANAPWIGLPKFNVLHYGVSFSWSAIITFIIIFAVLMTETTGTWFAMSAATGEHIDDQQWNHGMIGEGLNCFIASLIGASPVTSYSTNAGIISITGVASKRVFIAAGGWFIVLGLLNKVSAFLSAIPSAVIGGVFAVIAVIIMLNGLKVIKGLKTNERDYYIIGVPIILTMALILIPLMPQAKALVAKAPKLVQYLMSSPISISAIASILLNIIMPDNQKIQAGNRAIIKK